MNTLASDEIDEAMPFGGFWKRAGDYLLDLAVLILALLLVSFMSRSSVSWRGGR